MNTGGAGPRGALLLAVAMVLGIVLLQALDTGTPSVSTSPGTTTTVPFDDFTGEPLPETTTTVAARQPSEVKVLVANGSGVSGAAATKSTVLKNAGYQTLAPATVSPVNETTVQFAEGYEAEAQAVAAALSLPPTAVVPVASPPPVALGAANVLVVLARDTAPATTRPATATTRAATATTRAATATTRAATATTKAATATTKAPASASTTTP